MGLMSMLRSLLVDPPAAPRTVRHVRPAASHADREDRRTAYLWQDRGWIRNRDTLTGYYRTRRGAFRGRITGCDGSAKYYVTKPPKKLLSGPHGACFRERGGDEFLIHFNTKPKHPDQGILYVEQLLLEAS